MCVCVCARFAQVLRVFYDRLVDKKDGSWFLAYLKTVVQVRLHTCKHSLDPAPYVCCLAPHVAYREPANTSFQEHPPSLWLSNV